MAEKRNDMYSPRKKWKIFTQNKIRIILKNRLKRRFVDTEFMHFGEKIRRSLIMLSIIYTDREYYLFSKSSRKFKTLFFRLFVI